MNLLVVTATVALFAPKPQGQPLGNLVCNVRVDDTGLLVGVPARGLHTVDGPAVTLEPGRAEWCGVAFTDSHGHVRAAASGLAPDWAGRTPIRSTAAAAAAGATGLVAHARVGALEIETNYRFDPDGTHLLVTVDLTNRGTETLHELFVTREWEVRSGGISFPTDWIGAVGHAPDTVARRIWMFDDLRPGASTGATFAWTWEPRGAGADGTVPALPLVWWTSPSFPTGLVFGAANGVSWGDYDRDGWIDVFCLQSARLWRNLGGTGWQLVADFDQPPTQLLAVTQYRYGSSFGDYDNDGLPDLAVEPRGCCGGDTCFHLLQNLGGGPNFTEVATPAGTIITEPCGLDAETAGWADVDNDGDLDLFVPVYPPWVGSAGNFFWTNLGPTGPGGACRFQETSAASGLDNPPNSARPEGAQFCDVDADGDIDLYSNGTLYQNNSTAAQIDFDNLTEATSGIGLSTSLDEGAVLFDYDMDGDYDLFVVYSSQGVKIWENQGDGTFFAAESNIVDSPFTGLDLGMSAEDWDNDGDIDFTTRQVFRRNMFAETGTRHFTVLSHSIPPSFLTSATPAWGDWDRDGDLDCALGNWLESARLYQNVTYGPTTPLGARRYVRVKPLRDSATVAGGLETEFGASVEIRIAGETDKRRKKFTASGHGYLNQNEYTLHFALPPDPNPADPTEDLRFDVVVDFPTRSAEGVHRVDKHVNPALGSIDLASLSDREIQVFRSGKVRINGCEVAPWPREQAALRTSAGGLRLPSTTVVLPAPTAAPGGDHFVGLDFDTIAATGFVRVAEIVLDGQLGAAVAGPEGPFNLALWDVTDPIRPQLAPGRTLQRSTSPRNRRSFLPVDWLLPAGHRFRLVAHVAQLRATSFAGPLLEGSLHTNGGLAFADTTPANGANVAAATVDPTKLYLAIRFRDALVDEWVGLGGALPGSNAAIPVLVGSGALIAGNTVRLDVRDALPAATAFFLVSTSVDCQPLLSGIMFPDNPIITQPLLASSLGTAQLSFVLPGAVPSGTTLVVQTWMLDAGNPGGVSATNAVWVSSR
ncbi:MAG TPA: VCBS repeat-containing protein [Planctomycetota bacterium]|nr:VCBS repeat-containing protein [Planctomycetota bacterium]